MTREKFIKLPKWAQTMIFERDHTIAELNASLERLNEAPESSIVVDAYGSTKRFVPNHTVIKFELPTGSLLVHLTEEGDAITINGLNESLSVHPMASNSIEVDHDC